MKNSFLLILCAFALFVTSCQRKQMAYFQKSSSEQITHAKKVQPVAPVQEVQSATAEEIIVPTAPVEASASVTEEIVPINSVVETPAVVAAAPATETKKVAKWKQKLVMKQLAKVSGKLENKSLQPKADYDKLGKIAGILGILGVVLVFIPQIAVVGLLAGLAAFIMGLVSVKKASSKGWSLVGIIGGALILLLYLTVVVLLASIFV